MSANSFVKWYGFLSDLSVKRYQTMEEAFEDGCPYSIREIGYIYPNGSWPAKHRYYDYNIINKKYPTTNTSLEINSWNGYVKKLESHSQLITFIIRDKHYISKEFTTTNFIQGVIQGIEKLKNFSTFQDWRHYDLHQKSAEQDKKIRNLEEQHALQETQLTYLINKNRELGISLNNVTKKRNDVQKLYQALFEKEIKEGIQHLLNCKQISDKDLAVAFGITQKKVKELKY